MDSDITPDNITRAALRAGLTVTAEEAEAVRAHLVRQTKNFAVLSDVNTDGVQPYYGDGGDGNAVPRSDA